MKYLKWLLLFILLPLLIVVLFLLYSVVTDYRPAEVEDSISLIRNGKVLNISKPLEITTYNIGYAGLDKGQNFFMDGGTSSRSLSKEKTTENLNAIMTFLKAKKSDVYLLQEVDRWADRSYEIDEIDKVTNALLGYNASFAYNYRANWVPVPLLKPMGTVKSGILTLSKADYESSIRYTLPGDEPIPKRYFDLKRCVMQNTYQLSNGKQLILINIHLSAFDKGGEIRAKQIDWLSKHLQGLYKKEDNYVVVGGDWNHILSEKLESKIIGKMPSWVAILPSTILKETGFKMIFDENVNTVRSLQKSYVEGESFETIIDGFLVSPNVKVLEIKGTKLGYENSDHQPVTIKIGF